MWAVCWSLFSLLLSQEAMVSSQAAYSAERGLIGGGLGEGAQLESERPFRALGFPAGESQAVRYRVFSRGAWSRWMVAEIEAESGTVVWLETPVQRVEIEAARPTRVLLIEPGVTPARSTAPRAQAHSATSGTLPGVIRTRTDWCPAPFLCPANPAPSMTIPTHLVVHHTAGGNQATDWAAVVRSIWELHVRGNGWADIGYNFLIDPTGVVYEGRGDGVLGAHFSGVNGGTSGVALLGTYSRVPGERAALDRLVELLAWQAARWRLDPWGQTIHAASGLELNVIGGHRDAALSPRASGSTECPGNALYAALPEIRDRVCRATADCLPRDRRPNRCIDSTGPCVARFGVIESAEFSARPVVAGSLISIFGNSLDGVQASVNGRAARITFTSPRQVNLQVPPATPIGTARLVLTGLGGRTAEVLFWVTEAAPALYRNGDGDAAAIVADSGAVLSRATPVRAGTALSLFLTGAGSVTPAFPGGATPLSPLFFTTRTWSASIGGQPAEGLFLGLAPGFLGLYQANIRIPAALVPGEHAVSLTVDGVTSQPARIWVD